jgi:hypothetical protein
MHECGGFIGRGLDAGLGIYKVTRGIKSGKTGCCNEGDHLSHRLVHPQARLPLPTIRRVSSQQEQDECAEHQQRSERSGMGAAVSMRGEIFHVVHTDEGGLTD